METGEDAAIAPEPAEIASDDACGDVGCGLFHVVGAFGGFAVAWVAHFHGDEVVPAAAATARPEHEVTGDEWGADASFVEGGAVFPSDRAVFRTNGVDAVGLTVEDEQAFAEGGFEEAGGGVGDDLVFPRGTPNGFSRSGVDGDDETFTASCASWDGFLSVLFSAEDDHPVDDDGGGAACVLADEGAEVALPELFAGVVERGEPVVIGIVPDGEQGFAGDGWCCGGEGVEFVFSERVEREILAPIDGAIGGPDAEHGDAAVSFT